MAESRDASESPQGRREFFRRSLAELLRPAAAFIEAHVPGLASVSTARPLRPPGALAEPSFLEACYRCGSCADHCPANAISLLQSSDPVLKGTPAIDPTRRACVMCDDLTCMKVCPSGALRLLPREGIRIGLAVWNAAACLRQTEPPHSGSGAGDVECRVCVDDCPLGEAAIRMAGDRIQVIDPRATGAGCTGCGVCQERCPTRPERAIVVLPYAGRAGDPVA